MEREKQGRREMLADSPWIVDFTPDRRPRVRLLCFPYAGGGANVYRSWVRELPPEVGVSAVQLPGREGRFSEPPLDRVGAVVAKVSEALARLGSPSPLALFGHSMGSVLAFEVARALQLRGDEEPIHLMIAGRTPPSNPTPPRPISGLPDGDFLDELGRLGGTPPQILEEGELMDLMLPMLRADFRMNEGWIPSPGPLLSCPITTFAGRDDPEAPPDSMEGWRRETRGPLTHHVFPGGHFFPVESRSRLLGRISSILG